MLSFSTSKLALHYLFIWSLLWILKYCVIFYMCPWILRYETSTKSSPSRKEVLLFCYIFQDVTETFLWANSLRQYIWTLPKFTTMDRRRSPPGGGHRGGPPPPHRSRPPPGYKVLCVSSLHPKASDDVVRDTLYREYKKYGDISVRVMQESLEWSCSIECFLTRLSVGITIDYRLFKKP